MARILVLCQRPYHLNRDEADAWFREAAGSLTRSPQVGGVEVAWLQSASERHPRAWDLLLAVTPAEGADPATCVAEPACAELLGDLRLLGMRPSVLVLGELEAL